MTQIFYTIYLFSQVYSQSFVKLSPLQAYIRSVIYLNNYTHKQKKKPISNGSYVRCNVMINYLSEKGNDKNIGLITIDMIVNNGIIKKFINKLLNKFLKNLLDKLLQVFS